MDIKDVKLNLVVKSNKVARVLHLLLSDAITDFQNNHPKSIPSLLASLKRGDTEEAIKKIDNFLDTVGTLKNTVEDIRGHIIKSMPDVQTEEMFGGKSFIDPDGNVVHKISEDSKKVVIGGPPADKKPIKKKAPAKKRATKKKAKIEEE